MSYIHIYMYMQALIGHFPTKQYRDIIGLYALEH